MSPNEALAELIKFYLAGLPAKIEEIENLILELEQGVHFSENFEALFRNTHSLKGSGGTYGFLIISSICHQMEDYLSDNFKNASHADPSDINVLLKYVDILKEAHTLLLSNSTNFSNIETQLEAIKQTADHRLRALVIGQTNNTINLVCQKQLELANIHSTHVDSGMIALIRLLHEHFDILITAQEILELNGIALISALKLNRGLNSHITTLLITSNPNLSFPNGLQPDHVILKDKNFASSLSKAIENPSVIEK